MQAGLHLALGTHSQYIAYQAEQKHHAEFDGTVVSDRGQLFPCKTVSTPAVRQAIPPKGSQLAEGDTVFPGDTLDVQLSWTAGPHRLGRLPVKLSWWRASSPSWQHPGRARPPLPNPALRNLAVTYVELIRGTPLLVQIFIVYFVYRHRAEPRPIHRWCGGARGLHRRLRGGDRARRHQLHHKGQMEAGRSLGMTSAQTMRYVILPQAFRRVLPPLAGQFINLIKDSSLVSVISITDLTKAGREVVSSTFSPFEVWFTVALLYLVLTGTLSFLVRRLEVKYARSN